MNAPVEPLLPAPGRYEAIVRRARRRRLNRAVTAAGAAAAVVAAAVFVPQLARVLIAQGTPAAQKITGQHATHTPRPRTTADALPSPQGSAGPGPLVTGGFAPDSVTFVGLTTGWALGRSTASCPGGGCTALARTDDTGQHWYSVRPPATGAPDGSSGVSQVRFLNTDDGWAFGPQLWATHDGGQSWNEIGTGGRRVVSLETTGDRVFAVFAHCAGTGSGWNTGCSSYQLYSAAAAGGVWAAVPGGSGPGAASVVLTRTTGYLLAQDGESVTVSRGPVTGGGTWTAAAPVPCAQQPGGPSGTQAPPTSTPAPGSAGSAGGTGSAGSTGAPPTPAALLASGAPSGLFLLCTGGPGADAQHKAAYLSSDGGGHWQQRQGPPAAGTATSVAATGSGALLVATGSGVYVSRDGGATWQMSLQVPDGGIGYVGMTDTSQGFAVPAHSQGVVWFTGDGGESWHQSVI